MVLLGQCLPLCRAALDQWSDQPCEFFIGRLVLVEGLWANGTGLAAEEVVRLIEQTGRPASLTRLQERNYWGRDISDDRYLVLSRPDEG